LTNTRRGYDYFTSSPRAVNAAEGLLVNALDSDDPQQQLLAALILGQGGKTYLAERLASILIPHLRDNRLRSDAGCAAYALRKLGSSVRNPLHAALGSDDAQQRSLAGKILDSIQHADGKIESDVIPRRRYLQFAGWEPKNFPAYRGDPEPPPPPEKPIIYTAVKDDTLDEIARLFIISRDKLMQLNNIVTQRPLRPGEQILIPPSAL